MGRYSAYTAEAILAMPYYRFLSMSLAGQPTELDAQEAIDEAERLMADRRAYRARQAEEHGG